MAYEFQSGIPIYRQITDEFIRRICSGKYPKGGELPSVREASIEFSVNPNTMQHAFSELEQTGLASSRSTSGRFVTKEGKIIEKTRFRLARQALEKSLKQMRELGLTEEQIIDLLHETEDNL